MVNQLSVLVLISGVLYAGAFLRRYALAGDGCKDCNCGSDNCCEDEGKN